MSERYECYATTKPITVTRYSDPRLLLRVRQQIQKCEQDGGCPEEKCQIKRLEERIYSGGKKGELGYLRCMFCEKLKVNVPSSEESKYDEWTDMPMTVYERTCSMQDKISGSFIVCEVPDEFIPKINIIFE